MTANQGYLAQCDAEGCDAELRVYRGQPWQQALHAEGWTWSVTNDAIFAKPEWVHCPKHRSES